VILADLRGRWKRFTGDAGRRDSQASRSASTAHTALGEVDRRRLRITEGLVRLSVGIEDKDDLIADLEQALGAV
jgi:cystathionine beta-lyase/cystathionine gamma-synthase